MIEIKLINNIFLSFLILCDFSIFFKFSKDISKLKDVKRSKRLICASTLILINLIFSYFFNDSSTGYILIMLCLISYFIYLKTIYKNLLIENLILTFSYHLTSMVCSNITYTSIEQLGRYIKSPWFVSKYIPGILSIVVTYLFTTKVATKLINFKEFKIKIKEFYFLLFFYLIFLIRYLIFYDYSSPGLRAFVIFITTGISMIWLTSIIAMFYYKDEKQKKIIAEKEAIMSKRTEIMAKIGAVIFERVIISMQKEKNEKESITEKENIISQIKDVLSGK